MALKVAAELPPCHIFQSYLLSTGHAVNMWNDYALYSGENWRLFWKLWRMWHDILTWFSNTNELCPITLHHNAANVAPMSIYAEHLQILTFQFLFQPVFNNSVFPLANPLTQENPAHTLVYFSLSFQSCVSLLQLRIQCLRLQLHIHMCIYTGVIQIW